MKKSLFALAAVTAFAGAAQAQSSVTVYGLIDAGFQGSSTRVGPNVTNATLFTAEGSQSTSRIGFRGTEDLGGGMAAFFTLEMGLVPTPTANSAGGALTGTGISTARAMFVGLSQKGIGQFAVGTQNTPVHNAVVRTDVGQVNNISGNVIYAVGPGSGSGETTIAYTVRVPNALTLQTERMAGFQISALYNNNNQSNNSGKNDNVAYGAGVNYVLKKFNLDVAWQNLKNTNQDAAGVNSNPAINSGTAIFGQSINQTQMYAGAVYDFGILKAYAQFVDSKAVANINSNQYIQRTAQQLGVRGNFSPKIEGWASVGNGRLTAGNNQAYPTGSNNQQSQNFTGYQVGANYILSKRTNAYAIFGSTQVSSSSIALSEGRNSYGIGVRHTF